MNSQRKQRLLEQAKQYTFDYLDKVSAMDAGAVRGWLRVGRL
jgi:hypothetical protein